MHILLTTSQRIVAGILAVIMLSGCIGILPADLASTTSPVASTVSSIDSTLKQSTSPTGTATPAVVSYVHAVQPPVERMRGAAVQMQTLLHDVDTADAAWQAETDEVIGTLAMTIEQIETMGVPPAFEPSYATLHEAIYMCSEAADGLSSPYIGLDESMQAKAQAQSEQCIVSLDSFAGAIE